MQYKYCPDCARMDILRLPDGRDECKTCRYVGVAREGNLSQINEYKKRLMPSGDTGKENPTTLRNVPKKPLQPGSPEDLKKRLESLKGKQFEGIEFL